MAISAIWAPAWRWRCSGSKAAAPTALIFCCDSIFLFSIVPLLIALTDRQHPSLLHTLGVVARQIVLNPLIMSACAGALAAALHLHPPVAIDNTLLFLQNAAAPVALFALGVTVALRPFGRVPWEVPGVIAVKLLIHPLMVFGLMMLVGPVRAAMGGDRGADGLAAAGAQCVRDRPAKRYLDRAGIGRRADRNLRLRRHAHQRDVVSCRPAGWCFREKLSARVIAMTAPAPRAWRGGAAGRIEPIRCRPAARSDCIGRKSLSNERFARSMTKVRLATSARRAD